MPPKKAERRPVQGRLSDPAPNTSTNDNPHSSRRRSSRHAVPGQTRLPVPAIADAYPPCPGRSQTMLVVRRCPECGGAHRHQTPVWPVPVDGIERRSGCGRSYTIKARTSGVA
jgi:hypothetical protein